MKFSEIIGKLNSLSTDALSGLASWIGLDDQVKRMLGDDDALSSAHAYLALIRKELAKLENEDSIRYNNVVERINKLANSKAMSRASKIEASKRLQKEAKDAMGLNDKLQSSLEVKAGIISDDITSPNPSRRRGYTKKTAESKTEKAKYRTMVDDMVYGIEKGVN